MSATRLRRAASLLRERAEAATPGLWEHNGYFDVHETRSTHGDVVAEAGMLTHDAAYIATMSPPVALALADWLTEAAREVEEITDQNDEVNPNWPPFAVADAILGATS